MRLSWSTDYADYAEMKDQRTYMIIGAALEVHRELGCGFLEAIYQEALEREFVEQGIPFKSQPMVQIAYKGKPLNKTYQPDFVCHDAVIVEIKALGKAVKEMEQGLIDANLGGGVVKKRLALPGRGKRGGAGTLVATNKGDRWFFLFGFGKNERANITAEELDGLRVITRQLLGMTSEQLNEAVRDGSLQEICHDRKS